jgi:beta-N-acetylhexosaminidase
MSALGESGDTETAEALGAALASEIGALGINLVFAPVLDVRFGGTTEAIGDRSLGSSPERVAELGNALIRGVQSAGLVACGKHFPGHGHVSIDSHLDLPVCDLTREELLRDHVAPFGAASEAGVGAIMSAHVRYPSVDASQPATFSKTWLSDILRGQLGFEGLVLTDDLEMGAVTGPDAPKGSPERRARVAAAAVRAVEAGADGLLICRDLAAIREAVVSLRRAADADPEFLASCRASLARLQQSASLHPPQAVPITQLEAHIGVPAHQDLASSLRGAAAEPGTASTGAGGDDPTEAVAGEADAPDPSPGA